MPTIVQVSPPRRSIANDPRIDLAAAHALGYDVLGHAATGTFSDVWQVCDRSTGRYCAWKQLRADWEPDPIARQFFRNEAEVGSQSISGHVVRVVHAETERSPRFIVLEWVAGRSLERLLTDSPQLHVNQALWIARQCAQGLSDLHRAGFTHGDVKPENIIIGPQGEATLLDLAFAQRHEPMPNATTEPQFRLLAGTPEYMAPESLLKVPGEGVAKDIYSLGVILYRMLSGRLPFRGETVAEVLRLQRESKPYALRRLVPNLTQEAAQLVELMLAKLPLRRPMSHSWLVDRLIQLELAELAIASD